MRTKVDHGTPIGANDARYGTSVTSPPPSRNEFHEFVCWPVAKQDKRMFTWASRGPDKRRECTGYGYRYKGMSVQATEDGIQNIVAGGGKVMRLSSGHGRVERKQGRCGLV